MGNITLEPGARPNMSELNAINWLHSTLGGDIGVLNAVNQHMVQTPDALWRGAYLEIKHVRGNLTTLDKQIRKGLTQTDMGTVLVDITDSSFSNGEATDIALKRLRNKGGGCAIIIRDRDLIAYIAAK